MSKNYFTDSKVEEIVLQIYEVTNKQTHDGSPIYEFTENRLKALMNLAVEAAIGKIVGYTSSFCIESILDGSDSTGLYRNKKDSNYEIPLYSVKELEN